MEYQKSLDSLTMKTWVNTILDMLDDLVLKICMFFGSWLMAEVTPWAIKMVPLLCLR